VAPNRGNPLSPRLFNALVIFLSVSIVAFALWSAPRLIPSAFSRFPGGFEDAKRRRTIGAVLLIGGALAGSGLAAVGFPVLVAILFPLLASVLVGLPWLAKIRRRSLPASDVFLIFFLLGPAFAASILILLANGALLVDHFDDPSPPLPDRFGVALLLLIPMELYSVVLAIQVVLFGLPASFLVATSATISYFVVKRVSIVAVIAALVAAIPLELMLAPSYFNYLRSHNVRRPLASDEAGMDATGAIFLGCVLHLVPALICWALVRDVRIRP
jgi:hypothetical protein